MNLKSKKAGAFCPCSAKVQHLKVLLIQKYTPLSVFVFKLYEISVFF